MKRAKASCLLHGASMLMFMVSLCFSDTARAADQVITLSVSRSQARCAMGTFTSIEQQFILTETPDLSTAMGVLVLFPGSGGKLALADGELGINCANFLVRSRHLFAAQGFHVDVMDAAVDFQTCTGGLRGRRTSIEFTMDMQAVMDDLRARYPGRPLWAIGTSRGSTAAAQAGVFVTPGPNGLVLTSSVTATSTASVFDVPLRAVSVPTLIVAHRQDGCSVTPPQGARLITAALSRSPKVKTLAFQGGFPPLDANPCQALTRHGFIGLERRVVREITMWIRQNS